MSLFFESIKIKNGSPVNLFYHNERTNRTRRKVLKIKDEIDLDNFIDISKISSDKIYKCRVFYDYEIHKVEFVEYEKRNIKKLIPVIADEISYEYKYTDRLALDKLKLENTKYPDEEILIVKNGFITDTSFSNIVLFDGDKWNTPGECLLPGTQRSKLLSENKIVVSSIRIDELNKYKAIKLINALVEFDEAETLLVDSIKI